MKDTMIHNHQLPFYHPADLLQLHAGSTRGNSMRQPSTPALPSCPAGAGGDTSPEMRKPSQQVSYIPQVFISI